MTWLLIANSNTCKIYQFEKKVDVLTLIHEVFDPKAKEKKSENLTTDKPGKMNHGQMVPHADPKEVEQNYFLHEVAFVCTIHRPDCNCDLTKGQTHFLLPGLLRQIVCCIQL